MFPTSEIFVSKSALRQNLNFIRKLIKKDTILSSVVKGNAYGHGIELFVPMAEKEGVRHFSVYNAQEAYRVKNAAKKDSEIMIMGQIENDQLEWAIINDVQFYIFEPDRLEHAIKIASELNKPCQVHLELETGMNRTGLNSKQLKQVKNLVKKYPSQILLKGICTHFSGAESITNYVRIKKQIAIFNKQYKWIKAQGINPGLRHTSCSAAIVNYPSTQYDMVRVGIMQYGYWPSRETQISYLSKNPSVMNPLRRLISWKTKVMSVKDVAPGEFVGYGTTFLAEDDMKIASIPIGYADGYTRSLSNTGRLLINEKRVSVIGIVNMNTLLVDITFVPQTIKGDEVVIIGEQGKMEITVASFSELSDQLNYELLTRLPSRIPRTVVK